MQVTGIVGVFAMAIATLERIERIARRHK